MKLNTVLLYILIILLNSCNSKNNKNELNTEIFKIFYSNKDSLIYDNSNLQFEINLDESTAKRFENDSIYYECFQYQPTKGNLKYNIAQLKRINSSKLKGYCFINDGVGSLMIKLFTRNTQLPNAYDFQNIMVISKNNISNKGTYDNLLFTENKKDYFAFFYESMKYHPEYVDIYLNKWQAGFPLKYITRDTIKNDLDFLIKNHSNNPNLPIIKYIGYYLLKDSLNAIKEFDKVKKLESKIFNNWSVVTFMDLIKKFPITNQKLHSELCDSIAIHNFNTHFLYSCVRSGQDLVSFKTQIKSIKKYLQINEDPYFDMVLVYLWRLNKKQLNKQEIEFYFDRVKKYALDTNLFIKGLNKRMTCNTFKSGILQIIARYEIENLRENELLEYISKYIEVFKYNPMDESLLYFYEIKSKINHQFDSAAFYSMKTSYSIGFPLNMNKLMDYHKKSKSNESLEEWTKKIRAKCFADIRTNAKKVPENLYSANYSNKQISMNTNRLKVIEYFSVICSPCIENIKNIEKYRKANPNSKIDFIFISADEKKESEEFLRKIGVKDEIPSNSGEFVRLLGIDNFPTTLFIDKNNNIVRNENGGGASSFAQSLKEFEENNK